MKNKDEILKNRETILRIAQKHGAYNIRLFGSYATGTATPESDVDLLVEVREKHSPWFPGGLVVELQEILGIPVDIVTANGLNKNIKDHVLAEAIPL